MTDDATLDAIAPIEQVLQIEGNPVRIRPLTIGQLPAFSRAIGPAVPALQSMFATLADPTDGAAWVGTDEILAALESSESIIEAVRVAAGLDREFLDRQGLDVLVKLAGAVFQVNADFFGRALAPAAVEVIERAIPTGTGSSSDSLGPGSPGPTS